jgi:hypothetical protein
MSAIRNLLILGGIGAGVYFASKVARGHQLVGSPLKCFPLERFASDCTETSTVELSVGSVNGYKERGYYKITAPGHRDGEVGPASDLRFGEVELLVRYPDGSESDAVSTGITASEYLARYRREGLADIGSGQVNLIVRSAPGPQAKIDLENVDPYDTDVKASVSFVGSSSIPDKTFLQVNLEVGDWMKGSTIEVTAEVFGTQPPGGSSDMHRGVYKFLIEVT